MQVSGLNRIPRGASTVWPKLLDLMLFLAFIGTAAAVARVGAGMFVPFSPPSVMPEPIDLSPWRVPYYVARSNLRMFIALPLSILFSLIYGYVAAHSKRAERLMIPILDILQSVPVLGFLSVTVTGFIALFRGSLLGLEAASIFAVFTGQAWNLTFAFYQSLRSLPDDLREACRTYQLGRWQTFKRLELPSSVIPLVWNGMMSFGGGWFFVSASESMSVLNTNYTLPGIGSYVTVAIQHKNLHAILYAILAIAVVIILTDQLLWRPLIAWSHRYKMEQQSEADDRPESWLYDMLLASLWVQAVTRWIQRRLRSWTEALPKPAFRPVKAPVEDGKVNWVDRSYTAAIAMAAAVLAYAGLHFILAELDLREVMHTAGLALATLSRVIALVLISSLIWVPVGVAMGFRPQLARLGQPMALFLASFPANFLFPFATAIFLKWAIPINIGSALLMAFGTQWYVLFNVIGGAQAIPAELREMARTFGLRHWPLWRALILPGIFRFWVTVALTAAGGAWNASIVAEVVSWGSTKLKADGLGAYIADATEKGDWPRITLGVGMMALVVVLLNRTVWNKLYNVAVNKYSLS